MLARPDRRLMMAMRVVRKRAGANFGNICLDCASRFGSQIGKLFNELRMKTVGQTENVIAYENLAVAVRTGTDADGGDRQLASDLRSDRSRDEFKHDRKGPGLL